MDPPFCFEAKLQLLYTLCYVESNYCLRPSYRIVPPILSCHTLIILQLPFLVSLEVMLSIGFVITFLTVKDVRVRIVRLVLMVLEFILPIGVVITLLAV